jgi:mono/diheme cytochrome c family protein
MKTRNTIALLGAIFMLLGSGVSLTATEDRETSRTSVSKAPARGAQTENSMPAGVPVPTKAGTEATPDPGAPTYLRDVLPIIMGRCMRCHNPQAKLLYDWSDYKTAFGDRWEIERRVWDSWQGRYYKQVMPVGAGPPSQMTEQERKVIRNWVRTGATLGVPPTPGELSSKAAKIEFGKGLFAVICTPCHQATGGGIPERFPPLAASDFLNADKDRAIRVLLNGLTGEVTVNGQKINSNMPQFPLSDEDIAGVLTFVYNSFGNSGKEVSPEEVKAIRKQLAEARQPHGAPPQPVAAPAPPSPFE